MSEDMKDLLEGFHLPTRLYCLTTLQSFKGWESVFQWVLFSYLTCFRYSTPLLIWARARIFVKTHIWKMLRMIILTLEREIFALARLPQQLGISFPESDQDGYGKSDITCKSPKGVTNEWGTESCCESATGICNACLGNNRETDQAGSSDVKINNDEVTYWFKRQVTYMGWATKLQKFKLS